ncbi:MAG: dNTP triphosphohydrolase [Bryobacteraceae bacterium]|nr:dNTP triphosphohydrolase [Bryobacteraceae bacterium]
MPRGNRRSVRAADQDGRFQQESSTDGRTPGQRDRDRVLYSGPFARLAEITQVVSPENGYVFHNRLTHSLKVGQIARRLAEKLIREQPEMVKSLGGLDPDTAEAAGLAHDLGHPPFGHIAEEELDSLVREQGLDDGYEGNAQSFRIVVRLASSDARYESDLPVEGLNLTRRTLDGILKYPWAWSENSKKWGSYRSEQEVFEWVRLGRSPAIRSATAEIMDWADDITFAIHDLLDFFRAGRIPIDRCKVEDGAERTRLLNGMFKRKPDWARDQKAYQDAVDSLLSWFPFEPDRRFTDSGEDRAKLYDFSSALIRYFVDSFHIRPTSASLVDIEPQARQVVEVLKQFIWEYVIENPELAVLQNGQREAVRTVFSRLLESSKEGRYYLFPPSSQDALASSTSDAQRVRITADCVSGMTERELMRFYRCLLGLPV